MASNLPYFLKIICQDLTPTDRSMTTIISCTLLSMIRDTGVRGKGGIGICVSTPPSITVKIQSASANGISILQAAERKHIVTKLIFYDESFEPDFTFMPQ